MTIPPDSFEGYNLGPQPEPPPAAPTSDEARRLESIFAVCRRYNVAHVVVSAAHGLPAIEAQFGPPVLLPARAESSPIDEQPKAGSEDDAMRYAASGLAPDWSKLALPGKHFGDEEDAG